MAYLLYTTTGPPQKGYYGGTENNDGVFQWRSGRALPNWWPCAAVPRDDVARLDSIEENNEAADVNRESTRSSQSNGENEEEEQQEVVERPARDIEDAINRANANDPAMTEINLYGENNDDARAARLADALSSNTHVTTLNLRGSPAHRLVKVAPNGIGDDGVTTLASALRENSTLQVLHLSSNNIGPMGASSFAEALRKNSSLRELSLQGNRIGDDGVTSLASALRENATLQTLYLYGNNIGDDGLVSLAEALGENDTLQSLHLEGNRFGNEGASSLASAMGVNTTLTSLELDFHGRYFVQEKIDACLERNREISKSNETRNRISEQYNMRSAEGLVDALVDLNNTQDIFVRVMFDILRDMPYVMDRHYFSSAN